jgi:hypothetical protein
MVAVLVLAGLSLVVGVTAINAQPSTAHTLTLYPEPFHPIRNFGSGLCLQPTGVSFDDPIVQAGCNGSSAQAWYFVGLQNNHYMLANADGWCINVAGELVNGQRVQQDQCQSSNAEWKSRTQLPAEGTLRSQLHFRDNNFCLDAPGEEPGQALRVWECKDLLSQRWIVGIN